MNALIRVAVLLWVSSVSSATAFAPKMASHAPPSLIHRGHAQHAIGGRLAWNVPRGGEQAETAALEEESTLPQGSDEEGPMDHVAEVPADTVKASTSMVASASILSRLVNLFALIGRSYSTSLEARPILTKSCTAGLIFGLSDVLAQKIERSADVKVKMDWRRLLSTTLVGLLYFGPAAHYWYEWIFRLIPGTGLTSTLYKAFWGQLLFGPSFTCIFFAANLLQSGEFSLKAWWNKICNDLPGACLAGVGYWPIVDLISYSVIPVKLIPLFVNMASLVWTVYLSLVANRGKGK
jgi:protein Mpv17